MLTAVLKAHYDGERIVLDEPCELPVNTPLMVTVSTPGVERTEWLAFSAQGLARAYGDDEPEYSASDVISQ